MDNVAISRRNHTNKKENKENTQPAHGGKVLIKRDKVAPFQLKGNDKHQALAKNGPPKMKGTQVDGPISSEKCRTNVKSEQKVGKDAADVRKMASEVPKPRGAVPSRAAPGMYKGKIVQSKIGSIWKSGATAGGAEPSALKTESSRFGTVTECRSKAVGGLPSCSTQKPASRSVLTRPTQPSKPTDTSHPPARADSATLTRTRTISKEGGIQTSKPKITVTNKVNKPRVSSSLSQYRTTVETTEQKRAKLAEWLASKGKTLKRPAMTSSARPKTKVSAKPEVEDKSPSRPAIGVEPKTKPSVEAHEPDCATAGHCAGAQEAHGQTPAIMDTSLELLQNSVEDVLEDTEGVDGIVVNLCDALEAMATLSRFDDERAQGSDEPNVEIKDNQSTRESTKEAHNKMLEDSREHKLEQVQDEGKESLKHKVETDEGDGDEEEEDHMENEKGVATPCMENASIIKYSIKTTPYLQSVKKTIEVETGTSTSRRKGNIKDLKFLTPVRRSCRIQRKSSHLPSMLVDHDPCVASLAELVKLDDDPNAYIYRKNPALLKDMSDQPES